MAVTTTKTNKPLNPRGNDQSPKGYNRAELYTGKALDFDGSNDNLTTQYAPSSNIQTTAYWVKLNASQNQHLGGFILGTTNQYGLYYWGGESNKNFGFNTWASDSYGITLPDFVDDWFHIVAEYNFTDFTQGKIYINGQDVGTLSQTRGTTQQRSTTGRVFEIGTPSDAELFGGQINGIKIFEGSLTAAQVSDLYNNPEKIVPTGVADSALKLWLPMQEGAGTTAYDGSGNGNHGTISGATWTHGIGAPVSQTAVIDWNKSHNYIDKSEEFETASWTENRLVTITDDSFIAPDGSATATEIVENTANDTHFLAQTLSVTAGDYFISVYAKKRDYDFIQISTGGDTSRYANFNISTGATGNANGITDLIIEDAGNGWYRIGGKITTSATSFNYFVTLIQSDVASRFQTYTGTDKGQYIWGAQATKSSTLQPYLRNIGTSAITSDVLLPQGLTSGRDITGVNLFENVRKQGALNLDGNSWAEVHDNASLDITDAITLEAWVYWDDASAKGVLGRWHIDASSRNYLLYKLSATNISFYINSNNLINQGGLTATKGWTHIVGTYNRTNAVLYIDGVQQATAAHTNAISTGTLPVEIGRNFTTANQALTAPIAQPRIYNRALTAEEVERNFTAGKYIYTND